MSSLQGGEEEDLSNPSRSSRKRASEAIAPAVVRGTQIASARRTADQADSDTLQPQEKKIKLNPREQQEPKDKQSDQMTPTVIPSVLEEKRTIEENERRLQEAAK